MTPEQMEKLGVSEDLRGEPIFKDIPDVPTLFKVARDNHVMARAGIRVPGKDASADDKKAFVERIQKDGADFGITVLPTDDKREGAILDLLGRPKDPKEYAPPKDHGLPDTVIDALRADAVEEGLTKTQFEKRCLAQKKVFEARSKLQNEQVAALKKELGAAFEERLQEAATVAKKLGAPDAEVAAIKEGKVPVENARMYLAMVKALGGSPDDLGGNTGGREGKLTPAEARARVEEIMRNPIYLTPTYGQRSEHERLKEEVQKLMPFAYPDDAKEG